MNPCPACGATEFIPLFEKNRLPICACRICSTAFVPDPPSPEAFKDYYSLDYFTGNHSKFGYIDYAAEEPFQAASFRHKAERITRAMGGGRILDVGCATSSFLMQLGPAWKKHGAEISQDLLKAYPPPPEVSMWTGDFLDYPENGEPFDVVTLWDVLDHVPNPKATLEKCWRLLRPGGMIAINVGDRGSLFARCLGRRWHLYIPPTHLTFFNRSSLFQLLKNCRFTPQRWEYEGRWVPLSLCFFRLSYIINRTFIRKLYEWSLRSALRNLSVYINLRDVVTVYAVKA